MESIVTKKADKEFHESIKKLKSLRVKLCNQQSSWKEAFKSRDFVINELQDMHEETLSSSIQALNSEIQDLKQEITRMREREDRVDELRAWKDKVDEVASPTQIKAKFDEVEDLKLFKTKAITIFAVVQFGMAFFAWGIKFIN